MIHPGFVSRRGLLKSAACGFGYMALAGLSSQAADGITTSGSVNPAAAKLPPLPAKAKRVIFLFMRGGPPQMDTFDPKPLLTRDDGKDLPFKVPRLQQLQKRNLQKLLASPFNFKQHGQGGLWVSELLPNIAKHADKLCVLKGMHTEGVDHGQATIKLHTGQDTFIRPSIGSWMVYGLGSENQKLPGFVSVCPQRSDVGVRGYSNAFLPGYCQGTSIGQEDIPASKATIHNITNGRLPAAMQRRELDFLQQMNRDHLAKARSDNQLEGVIESFELAFRMQAEAPKVLDISDESPELLKRYGIGDKATDDFGRQCLMARRFAESGVRYIQLTHTLRKNYPNIPDWDQHSNLKHDVTLNARSVDQPIAALLADLEDRGMLEDTLVWWGGEFGRTPLAEAGRGMVAGRDHNPFGFTMWLAGAGVKGGFSYGETDDYGYHAVQDKVHMHDLHATLLHLMGLDHEKLTYRYAGRDFRLTDVYGRVVHEIIA